MRIAVLLAAVLALSGCTALLPWAGVIAAGISLTSTVVSDTTSIVIHETPQAQPTPPVKP